MRVLNEPVALLIYLLVFDCYRPYIEPLLLKKEAVSKGYFCFPLQYEIQSIKNRF
jgi:hypothetical protein